MYGFQGGRRINSLNKGFSQRQNRYAVSPRLSFRVGKQLREG